MDATTQLGGPIVLFLLMLVVGLGLTPADFRRVLAAPRAVVGGTLAQWIFLPLMTWSVVKLLGVNPVFGAGAVLVAVSPGAGISNVFAALGRGNVALSVTLTATASVFAALTLPTIASVGLRVFLGEEVAVEVPVVTLVAQLSVSLLLPIGLGMWMRARRPDLALRLAPRLLRLALVAGMVGVVLWVVLAPEQQKDFAGAEVALVAAAVWTLSAMAIGWGTAAALGLPAADRFTFLVEFSARNIAVAVIVGLSGMGRVDFTFFSGAYFAVGYPLAGAAVLLRRRLTASGSPRPPARAGRSAPP